MSNQTKNLQISKTRFLIFFVLFLLFANILLFFFSKSSFSYSPHNTHPALTEEMAEFFNAKALKKELGTWNPKGQAYGASLELGKEEIEWLRTGSVREDEAPRWINHFYDPIHKTGWSGKHFGTLTQEQGLAQGAGMAPKPPLSSINWLTNQEYQSAYGRQYGNQTWQKAIDSYVKGDKKSSFIALGHILHLIEDLSVPDHTRDDTHAGIYGDPGSPYEDYAKEYTLYNKLTIAEELEEQNKDFLDFQTPKQGFEYLADYSNKNFFSEDTISNEEFGEPNLSSFQATEKITENGIREYFLKNNVHLFFKQKKGHDVIISTDDKTFILPSYRSHLFPQAVLTGASVINLFFQEVEKYKKQPELREPILEDANQPILQTLKQAPRLLALNIADVINKNYTSTKVFFAETSDKIQNSIVGLANLIKTSLTPKAVLEKSGQSALISSTGNPPLKTLENPEAANSELTEVSSPSAPTTPNLDVQKQNENELSPQIQPQIQNQNILNPAQNNQENQNLKTSSSNSGEDAPNLDVGHPSLEENSADLVSSTNQVSTNQASANQSVSLPQPLTSPSPGFGGGAPFVNQNNQTNPENPPPPPDTTPPNPPAITSPANFSQTFTISQIAFQGTAEASSTVKAVYLFNSATTTATTTVSQSGDWNLVLSLNQSTTTIDFYSIDAAANQSSSTSATIFIDSISPVISNFQIVECANSLSVPGESCLVATTTLNLVWSSTADDIDFYELSASGNQFASSSYLQASSSKFQALAEGNYTFSLRSKDKSGNWSSATTTQAEINAMPVIINEIAWAGTQASGADEWLELYNRTSKSVNLTNWILYSSADFRPYITLQNSIPARSYYLIERTNASTTDVSEDLTAPFGSGSGAGLEGNSTTNAGEPLYLVYAKNNSTTTIDYVPICGTQWCAGAGSSYKTMERINPDTAGNVSTNWRTNNGIIKNGKDVDNQPLIGTPKSRNSANYLISTTDYLTENKTLTKFNSPYFIEDTLTVQVGKTLTIEPGVVVKFQDAVCCLFIQGTLNAVGSSNDYIVFTSFHDDENGGDLDNNGNTIPPQKGQWSRVELTVTSSSTLSYVKFRYGGGSFGTGNSLLKINAAYATISNSIFEHSGFYGVELKNSNSLIASSTFQYNNNPSQGSSAGLYIEGGGPKISGNVFENNKRGMSLVNTQAEINLNSFASSTGEAVYVVANNGGLASFQNNTGSLTNGTNGIVFNVLYLQTAGTSTFYSNSHSFPYVFNGSATISASSTLAIQSNTTIKNSGNYLDIHGKLIAQGTNPTDIVFTSLNDIAGEWYRINAYSGSQISLSGTTIKHAGGGPSSEENSGVYADGSDVVLNNVIFGDNLKNGLVLKNSISSIKNSEFKNHTSPNLNSRGIAYYNSIINLENTTFRSNYWGVWADAASVIGTLIQPIIFDNNASSTNRAELFP